jgi:hypothetical protein
MGVFAQHPFILYTKYEMVVISPRIAEVWSISDNFISFGAAIAWSSSKYIDQRCVIVSATQGGDSCITLSKLSALRHGTT